MNEGGDSGVDATKKPITLEDFAIHVMPKEFLGGHFEAPKPSVQQLPQKPPVPVVVTPPPVQVPQPQATAQKPLLPPKKKSKLPFILLGGLIIVLLIGGGAWYYFSTTQVEPPVVIAPEPEPEPEPTPQPPRNSLDTDSDGLTDIEERLYGTDFRNPDTDGDSFIDGNEVFHGYNPLSFAPSTLLDSGRVQEFSVDTTETSAGYSFLYPVEWTAETNESLSTIITINANERIVITPMVLSEGMAPPLRTVEINPILFTTLEYDGVLFDLHYDISGTSIDYLQTFKMIANSFKLLE